MRSHTWYVIHNHIFTCSSQYVWSCMIMYLCFDDKSDDSFFLFVLYNLQSFASVLVIFDLHDCNISHKFSFLLGALHIFQLLELTSTEHVSFGVHRTSLCMDEQGCAWLIENLDKLCICSLCYLHCDRVNNTATQVLLSLLFFVLWW